MLENVLLVIAGLAVIVDAFVLGGIGMNETVWILVAELLTLLLLAMTK